MPRTNIEEKGVVVERVKAILSDHKWHSLGELVPAANIIPPEMACRYWDSAGRKSRENSNISLEERIGKGRRRLIERLLYDMDGVEIRGEKEEKEYRAKSEDYVEIVVKVAYKPQQVKSGSISSKVRSVVTQGCKGEPFKVTNVQIRK